MKRDMDLEKLLAGIEATVKSNARGDMDVWVSYKCGTPGAFGRMAIAAELEKLICNRIKRAKQAIVKEKA